MAQRSLAQKLRQHHAIEHGTVTLLSQRLPGVPLMARSDLQGFTLFGDADTHLVEEVAREALRRLQAGESNLAIHPNCGTNLVTSGMLSGMAVMMVTGGRKRPWSDRVPASLLAATLALIFAIPAGRWVQQNVTTSPHVEGLHIKDVTLLKGGPVARHRITIG